MKALSLGFLILTLSGAAVAAPFFLWDLSSPKDAADQGDLIMDGGVACNQDAAYVNYPGLLLAKNLPKISVPAPTETAKVLSEFKISFKNPDFFKLVWVMESYKGKTGPLVLLLPESHSHNVPRNASEVRDAELQFSRAYFTVGLIESNPTLKYVNSREGLEGQNFKIPNFNLKSDPLTGATDMAQLGYFSAFTIVANSYPQSSSQVKSFYLEKPTSVIQDAMLNLGEFDGRKSFEAVMKEVDRFYKGFDQFFKKSETKAVYDDLKKLSPKALWDLKNNVCVTRGNQMVEKTLDLAQQYKADVVILTFGALHYYEISQYLKKRDISFISLLGRTP